MKNIQNKNFLIKEEGERITSLSFPDDKYNMNWVEGTHSLGDTVAAGDISVSRTIELREDYLLYSVTFSNTNNYDIFAQKGSLGIYVPFNDSYGKASLCMTDRCHAHLNMCGSSSYIMGLRMGGESPHLGMVLCEGELEAYSIECENKSNDRGDFILHPPFVHLLPNKSYTLKLKFFRHSGKEDFLNIVSREKNFITINSAHFTYFKGEKIKVSASICAEKADNISVKLDNLPHPYTVSENNADVFIPSCEVGEHKLEFSICGKRAVCKYFVCETFEKLLAARCSFLAEHQQFCCPESALDGAFLAYDNDEDSLVYDFRRRDINSSRERIAMPLLILLYLKHYGESIPKKKYDSLHESLMRFVSFFKREIYDVRNGIVANDIGYENSKVRLYNYPWPARFFLDMYELEGDESYLFDAYNIMKSYYSQGGKNFYAFTIPVLKLANLFEKAGKTAWKKEICSYFREHADVIIANASNYPAHEVSYEQSIVAPAAEFLFQMYFLTKEERYLHEAEKQFKTAILFSGVQPHYQLYMGAIRHWDGFWFGKKRLYGDTFPHYWSVLSAKMIKSCYLATNKQELLSMAEDTLRGQLCQFTPDGRASCATLFPLKVNGVLASYADAWANDQDWALVYYVDFLNE